MNVFIIKEVLKKPNIAFEKISQNPQYFRLSLILFSSACIISFFNEISLLIFQMPYGLKEFPNIARHIVNFGGIILNNFLIIFIIFQIGKRFNGITNFKQTFSILSFCFIPIMIGTIILASSTLLFSSSGSTNDYSEPSYVSNFMLSPPMLSNFIVIPFGIWSLILYVKSVKIVNDFTTFKSIFIVIGTMLMMQGISMAYDLSTSIPLQLMYH